MEIAELPEKGAVAKLAEKYKFWGSVLELEGKYRGIPISVALSIEALLHAAQHCAAFKSSKDLLKPKLPTSETVQDSALKWKAQTLQQLLQNTKSVGATFKTVKAIVTDAMDSFPDTYAPKATIKHNAERVLELFCSVAVDCCKQLNPFICILVVVFCFSCLDYSLCLFFDLLMQMITFLFELAGAGLRASRAQRSRRACSTS